MKKMRKLIPAFAMLLVSAIMMSTASFAWFSMNDIATATGMSVQAKASGNLLISKNALNASTTSISVDMGSSKVNLFPITFNDSLGGSVGPWVVPNTGKDVDPVKGTYTGDWKTITADTVGNYFAQYVVYIATAGDKLTNQTLSVDLTGISGIDQEIAPAYTAAFYVVEQAADGSYATPTWNAPDAVHSYKSYLPAETGTAGKKVIKNNVTIPSTYGTNTENAVGTMVVIRIYIDGALTDANKLNIQSPKIVTPTPGEKYVPATMSGYTFYHKDNLNVAIDKTLWTSTTDISDYRYWNGEYETTQETVPYVRNTTVPTGATIFEMDFSCATPTP